MSVSRGRKAQIPRPCCPLNKKYHIIYSQSRSSGSMRYGCLHRQFAVFGLGYKVLPFYSSNRACLFE